MKTKDCSPAKRARNSAAKRDDSYGIRCLHGTSDHVARVRKIITNVEERR